MNRTAVAVLVAVSSVLGLGSACQADGVFVPDLETWKRMREQGLVNEPEQKAAIFFDKGREQLIISPKYEGPAEKFAWIIPVPTRPKVEIADEAIFYELYELAASVFLSSKRADEVKVLEKATIGAYDVNVLSATDGKALMKWLSQNGYHLPEKALEPVKSYVRRRWTFVACKIHDPRSAAGLRTGTLAPLKLTFASPQPVYPLRLSSANPEPFQLIVYLVMPSPVRPEDYRFVECPAMPMRPDALPWARLEREDGQWWREEFPLLGRTGWRDLEMWVIYRSGSNKVNPRKCTQDLAWIIRTEKTRPSSIPPAP